MLVYILSYILYTLSFGPHKLINTCGVQTPS